jgi:hypothetical protein
MHLQPGAESFFEKLWTFDTDEPLRALTWRDKCFPQLFQARILFTLDYAKRHCWTL